MSVFVGRGVCGWSVEGGVCVCMCGRRVEGGVCVCVCEEGGVCVWKEGYTACTNLY